MKPHTTARYFVTARRTASVALALLWTTVAVLSLAELTAADTHLAPRDWVVLTWTVAGLALLSTSVLCVTPRCTRPAHKADASWWGATRLHWLLHVCASTLVATLFAQFASHYSDSELQRLHQRDWHSGEVPAGLRLLTVVHWLQLHLLAVVTWLVVCASFLFAEAHALLPSH